MVTDSSTASIIISDSKLEALEPDMLAKASDYEVPLQPLPQTIEL